MFAPNPGFQSFYRVWSFEVFWCFFNDHDQLPTMHSGWSLPSRHQAIPLCHREALRGRAGDLVAGHAADGGAKGHTESGTGGPRHLRAVLKTRSGIDSMGFLHKHRCLGLSLSLCVCHTVSLSFLILSLSISFLSNKLPALLIPFETNHR